MREQMATMIATACVSIVFLGGPVLAQQSGKPLTNDDVLTMVQKKMPESVVVSAIKSSPGNYDTSANELIRLNAAGVTEGELNAMLAAAHKSTPDAQPAQSSSGAQDATSESKSRMPKVIVTQGKTSQELKLEKTQLTQTKNKPSSMKSLAADSTVTQAMQAGVSTASWDAAMHMNSVVGGTAVAEAGSVFSGMLAHRTPTVTYVWGVPSPASANVLKSARPVFALDFSRTPGINPDDYEPAIIKLTPAQNSCRIVGATQGKADAGGSPAADWEIYSHYLEDQVAINPQKLAPGKYKVAAASELLPGEYGLVIRPVSKTKKFSGGDVARAQGDGLMFDAIWTFQISADAQ
jgi:hypothetical protein